MRQDIQNQTFKARSTLHEKPAHDTNAALGACTIMQHTFMMLECARGPPKAAVASLRSYVGYWTNCEVRSSSSKYHTRVRSADPGMMSRVQHK